MAAEILDWESLNFIVSQNNQTGRNQFLSKMNKGDRKSVLQLSKILKLSIYHTHSQNSSVFQWRCSEITFLLFKFKSYLLLFDQAFSKLVMILKLCLLCALCRMALFLLTLHLTSRLCLAAPWFDCQSSILSVRLTWYVAVVTSVAFWQTSSLGLMFSLLTGKFPLLDEQSFPSGENTNFLITSEEGKKKNR